MRCIINIKLRNSDEPEDRGFGRGVVQLLEGIDRFGSINKATNDMGMAYSKAWRIINSVEKEFDIRLLQRDGAHGSVITPEGRRLMEVYNDALRAAEDAAKGVFRAAYPD